MRADSHTAGSATPATAFQRSVALASLAGGSEPVFVEQFVLEVPAGSDPTALRTAWGTVVERHPGLSAQYDFSGAQLLYRQLAPWNKQRSFEITSAPSIEDAERICASQYRPFAIGTSDPLWRVAAIDVAGARWFCVTLHHLIFDDRSWHIIRTELTAALRHALDPTPAPPTFEAFLEWHSSRNNGNDDARSRALAAWTDLTHGLEGPTALPPLAPCVDEPGENLRFPVTLDGTFHDRLHALMRDHQVTTNHVGLAAWALVLSRLCRTDVVCFGQTRHGVPAELVHAASIVGPMLDTVPFVQPVDDEMTLGDFLADVALRHRRMYALAPLEAADLVAAAFPPGTDEVMSTVVNHVRTTADTADATLPVVRQRKSAALQPTLTVLAGDEVRFEIVTSARHAEFGRVAAAAMGAVLTQIVERPRVLGDIATAGLNADPETELCGPARRFDAATLADLIESSLHAHAERLALDGAEQLTYAELERASLELAHRHGLTNRTEQACVAVLAPPGRHAVIAVVAVIRSGHAFVCIDPLRPAAEIRTLLNLIDPDVVIDTESQHIAESRPSELESGQPPRRARPDELAYLVATSGSTGVPKVVEIEQSSAASSICSLIETYAMTPDDRRLRSVSRPGADVFIAELLVPLCSGATLVEAIGDRPLTPAQFFALLDRERITIAGAASSYLAELVEARVAAGSPPAPRSLRLMTTGTEAVDPSMLPRWRTALGDRVTLLNVYGPAEATLVTTTCRLSDLTTSTSGPVPIGLPLPNARVMLLDRSGQPVPRGAVGEICIAGAGVMRGYRGIETPTIVAANPARSTERYYRTGDLGRIGPDGQLVFCGRSDRQVKIRGHRVELDGVEARLRMVTGGSTVAAVVTQRAGRPVLLAAVECDDPVDEAGIRASMAAEGSPAEVPAAVVGMRRLPRLANGKLDRRTIATEIAASISSDSPATAGVSADVPASAPDAFGVPAMVQLWNELFEVDDCHEGSDFFDLGGDSLLAIRLAAEIDVRFDLAMDLDLLYAARPLSTLVAAVLERSERGTYDVIRPLHVGSGGTAVFFMHTGFGLAHEWEGIARSISDNCDTWMISGRVARGRHIPSSVVEACRGYVEALASADTGQPCIIVGYSATGVLAYETARLAKAAGLLVRGVVLIETKPTALPRLFSFLASAAMVRRRRSLAAGVLWVFRRAVAIAGRTFGVRHEPEAASSVPPNRPPFVLLVDGHQIGPADFDVVIIESSDPGLTLDLRLAWTAVARRRVEGHVLAVGRHDELIDESNAKAIGPIIGELADRYLNRRREPSRAQERR